VIVAVPGLTATLIVKIIGTLILITGGVSLIISNKNSSVSKGLLSANGIFDIIFGILLLIFPQFFASLLVYLLGFILVVFGIGQIASVVISRSNVGTSLLFLIFPAILTTIGVTFLFNPFNSLEVILRIFGAALILLGINNAISSISTKRQMKRDNITFNEPTVVESTYEDVTEDNTENNKK
jgi:uncharacterized membrane protein HdeD (DUF308 family)